jgi:hypothetical protein
VAALFVESSAQVKRYLAEVGTAWIRTLLDPTAGAELNAAAVVEGLAVDDPNAHP